MSLTPVEIDRRKFLATSVAAAAALGNSRIAPAQAATAADSATMRPFKIAIPEEALADMKRRVLATRWPDRETVGETSQGLKLATMKAAADYWANEYDWRKAEDYLNDLPNFITTIDGVDIYQAPKSWVERAYPNLIHYNRLPKGDHFAAWEQPAAVAGEMRAAFKTLR